MNTLSRTRLIKAFSLIELLLVLATLSLLAALLFPVFLSVRGRARQATCVSNLRQISLGLSQYLEDSDGLYPHAVDALDQLNQNGWNNRAFPEFAAEIPRISLLQDVLQPYLSSKNVFACPADIGFRTPDYLPIVADAFPTSHKKLGASYFYRTELAAWPAGEWNIESPSHINVVNEVVGHWHGSLMPVSGRYSTLFADGHASSLILAHYLECWRTPLNSSWPNPSQYEF